MQTKKLSIAFVLFVSIVLMFTACDDGGGSSNASIGSTLNLSGRVYENPSSDTYTPYSGSSLTVNAPFTGAGTGTITAAGDFTFNITATPTSFSYSPLNYFNSWWVTDYSPDEWVDFVLIEKFDVSGDKTLTKTNYSESISGTSVTGTIDVVYYIYSDEAINFIGTGRTGKSSSGGYTIDQSSKNFTIHLEEGWNAVCWRQTTTLNRATYEGTRVFTLSAGNPDLKWVLK